MFMFICQLRTSVSLYFVSIVPFTRLEAFFPQPMRKLFQLMRNAVGHNKHRKLPLLQSINPIRLSGYVHPVLDQLSSG